MRCTPCLGPPVRVASGQHDAAARRGGHGQSGKLPWAPACRIALSRFPPAVSGTSDRLCPQWLQPGLRTRSPRVAVPILAQLMPKALAGSMRLGRSQAPAYAVMSQRMLHFVGIGAQKAGTTWLYEMLRQHPDISFPAGKEVHFWDKHRHRGLSWYTQLFDVPDGCVHGEITPAYSALPRAVIAQVASALPDLRMILVMRNPIERAWSAARMVLHREGRAPSEISDEWFVAQFRHPDSLARGDYETCIRNWRSAFPDGQLLVLTFDQLAEDPAGLVVRCLEHLGVEPSHVSTMHGLGARVHAGADEPLRPSLQATLRALYSSRIRSLEHYLRTDFSAWMK